MADRFGGGNDRRGSRIVSSYGIMTDVTFSTDYGIASLTTA
jgi:hypothetical protein